MIISLKALYISAQIQQSSDQMQVIFQDHVTVQLKPAAALQKPPGIQHYIHRRRTGKQRQPLIDRRGQEVRAGVLLDSVAAADRTELSLELGRS
jgi:hypothetical protein